MGRNAPSSSALRHKWPVIIIVFVVVFARVLARREDYNIRGGLQQQILHHSSAETLSKAFTAEIKPDMKKNRCGGGAKYFAPFRVSGSSLKCTNIGK